MSFKNKYMIINSFFDLHVYENNSKVSKYNLRCIFPNVSLNYGTHTKLGSMMSLH